MLAKPGNTAEDLLHPQFTCPPTISAFRNRSTLPPQRAVSTASFARAVMKTQLTSLTTSYKRCHSHAWHAHAQNASDYPYRPPQSRLVHKSRISYTCSSLSSSDRLPHLNTVGIRIPFHGRRWYVCGIIPLPDSTWLSHAAGALPASILMILLPQ